MAASAVGANALMGPELLTHQVAAAMSAAVVLLVFSLIIRAQAAAHAPGEAEAMPAAAQD